MQQLLIYTPGAGKNCRSIAAPFIFYKKLCGAGGSARRIMRFSAVRIREKKGERFVLFTAPDPRPLYENGRNALQTGRLKLK